MKYEERLTKAMEPFNRQVAAYEKRKNDARVRYYALQITTIVASAVTPLLILASVEKWIQALAPTIALVSTGILSTFQFKESWLRRARTVEALKSEFRLFDIRCGREYAAPVSDEQALATFVLRVEQIYADERGEWLRSRAQAGKPDASSQSGTA